MLKKKRMKNNNKRLKDLEIYKVKNPFIKIIIKNLIYKQNLEVLEKDQN